MPKVRTMGEVKRKLRKEGFKLSPSHRKGGGSHRRYIHPDGRFADLSEHGDGRTIAPGTLRNIEKTSGLEF